MGQGAEIFEFGREGIDGEQSVHRRHVEHRGVGGAERVASGRECVRDGVGAHAAGEQELLGTVTIQFPAVNLKLLHPRTRRKRRPGKREHAGRHVVGAPVALLGDAVEQNIGARRRAEPRQRALEAGLPEQLPAPPRLDQAVGMEAHRRPARQRERGLADARGKAGAERRRSGGGDRLHRAVRANDDRVGVATREFIGAENIMWSSDYPHTVSTWPHSRDVVERDFKDVPAKDKRQIVRDNAARLYGFERV